MADQRYIIEASTPFSQSLIWQLNRAYYKKKGLDAWRDGSVPHQLTSNALVGRTYAELIFAFLTDRARQGHTQAPIYLLELGAGHGRLAFHILQHLDRLHQNSTLDLPPYCYVLSDIGEDNLNFFQAHPQFQTYLEQGILDVAFFDAINSDSMQLRHSGSTIVAQELEQPILVLANYFFDSIPSDLFHFHNTKMTACSLSLSSDNEPTTMDEATLLKQLELKYEKTLLSAPFYEEKLLNEILESYRKTVFNSYLFFPEKGIACLNRLRNLSKVGLLLLSMDKGFHKLHELDNAREPEMITHGSVSFWVNYHALSSYCERQGGKAIFPDFSNFYSELACMFFLPESENYTETQNAYERFVNDFGPDDFNSLKRFSFVEIAKMKLPELIAMLRLSAYDPIFFQHILPRLKQLARRVTFKERTRLMQSMHQTWERYFSLQGSEDLAYELGGMFYDLGSYQDALDYFAYSVESFGEQADIFYNRCLCYYQLREDAHFLETLRLAKVAFPDYTRFAELEKLDLGAA